MKLLISNDDGVFADGIKALAHELSRHHEIFVSAPDRERSAVSRAMTLNEPLRAQKTRIEGLPDVPAFAVSGTPVDCVGVKAKTGERVGPVGREEAIMAECVALLERTTP